MDPEPRTRTRNPEPGTQNALVRDVQVRAIKLHAILDVDVAAAHGWDPADLAKAFFDGGAQLIQVRAKQLPSGSFLTLCDAVVKAAEPFRTAVIVNDRVDLAAMSGAAGVHVGQDDVPPAGARRILGDRAIVGYSTHTTTQIEAAAREPISYLAIGPVFGTRTKDTGYDAVGLARVAEAVRLSGGLPVVAIGGITLDNAPSVVAAGAAGVAVIGDLLAGATPQVRVAAYLRALGRV
jgi:thiamine-phosphate pyrophosphorylase